MGKENREIDFTVRHHALLFSCIAKSVVQNIGKERGESLFFDEKYIAAIKQYQAIDFEQLPEKEDFS